MDGGGCAGEGLRGRRLLPAEHDVIEEWGAFGAEPLAELVQLCTRLDRRGDALGAARVFFLEVEQAVGGDGEGVLAVDGAGGAEADEQLDGGAQVRELLFVSDDVLHLDDALADEFFLELRDLAVALGTSAELAGSALDVERLGAEGAGLAVGRGDDGE